MPYRARAVAKGFAAEYGGDQKAYDTASLKLNQVDTYLELGRQLQRAYGTHIDISLGFEVDYIPGFETDIQRVPRSLWSVDG